MSEVRILMPGGKTVAIIDTDDIERAENPRDVIEVAPEGTTRRWEFTGVQHLNITFKPGKGVRWETADAVGEHTG